MADTALSGLMAVRITTGCPKDAGEEDADDDGYDNEWGSDVHGGQILHYPDYQSANGFSRLCVRGTSEACGFMMNPPAFCSSGVSS